MKLNSQYSRRLFNTICFMFLALFAFISCANVSAQSVPSLYTPINPCMLYDARVDPGWVLAPNEVFYVDVRGECVSADLPNGIPEEANAVTVLLVGYTQSQYGYIKLWGSDVTLSTAFTSMDLRPVNADSSELTIRLCYPLSGCNSNGDLHGFSSVSTYPIVKAVGFYTPAE